MIVASVVFVTIRSLYRQTTHYNNSRTLQCYCNVRFIKTDAIAVDCQLTLSTFNASINDRIFLWTDGGIKSRGRTSQSSPLDTDSDSYHAQQVALVANYQHRQLVVAEYTVCQQCTDMKSRILCIYYIGHERAANAISQHVADYY